MDEGLQMFGYPVKSVRISTCGQLYSSLKESNKWFYRNTTLEGLEVDVEYADTMDPQKYNMSATEGENVKKEGEEEGESEETEESSAPVVVCLHGSAGSHRDYSLLIQYLSKKGFRVLAPNFPDFSLTKKSKVFSHSAHEKKEYLKDFFKAINITKIDLMVCHSGAIYPAVLLWEDPECPSIRSFALISPGGHRKTKKMWPNPLTRLMVNVYRVKFSRIIMRPFAPPVLLVTGYPFKNQGLDDVILSGMTVLYSRYRHLSEFLQKMREKQVPVLFMFCENDKVIQKKIFYEMASMLGAEKDHYSYYNEEGVLEQEGASKMTPWVVVLPFGHCPFIKYPKVVQETVEKFINFTMNPNNNMRRTSICS